VVTGTVAQSIARPVEIVTAGAVLQGDLAVPEQALGIVLFAHGSGSSRHSPRNRYVAEVLQQAGVGTLLMDLLTIQEETTDQVTRHLRFDIRLLADRLVAATDWLLDRAEARHRPLGYFGASTGAAAAIMASAARPDVIRAVVSRGGRPDLAGPAIGQVQAPTLLLVGGRDDVVIQLNQQAYDQMVCEKRLEIIPGATHLFEERGTLEQVAELAAKWFAEHFNQGTT
jgi:putative phosphoribosyl transferase